MVCLFIYLFQTCVTRLRKTKTLSPDDDFGLHEKNFSIKIILFHFHV